MYCLDCKDTGYELEPTDLERYEKEYNRLDATGTLEGYLCHRIACERTGYRQVPCTHCEKGRKIREENN